MVQVLHKSGPLKRVVQLEPRPCSKLRTTHMAGFGPYLAGLFKLGCDAGHHAQSGDEGQAGQDLSDAFPLHAEALDAPVAAADAALQVGCDDCIGHDLPDVKDCCPVGFPQRLICLHRLQLVSASQWSVCVIRPCQCQRLLPCWLS